MKAKEYVTIFEKDLLTLDWEKAIENILRLFYKEFHTLCESRKISCDGALIAIVNELDEKWQAFIRRTKVPHDYAVLFREVFIKGKKMTQRQEKILREHLRPIREI